MITVITINKDNITGLKKTINSIAIQTYKFYKHIIVDGSSRDGSIEYIYGLATKGDVTHLYDEGLGIYNAMNIGLMGCSSKYLFYLNSGDVFSSKDSLKILAECADGADVVHGMFGCKRDKVIEYKNQCEEVYFGKRYQHNIPSLASSLILREKLLAVKGFNTRYKISSDVEVMYKIALSRGTFRCVQQPIVVFDTNGISSKKPIVAIKERFMILLEVKPTYVIPLMREVIAYVIKKLKHKINEA